MLKKKCGKFLSLDLGQLYIKIVHMEGLGDGFRLLNYDLKKIPLTLEDISEITDFIKTFIKNNSIVTKKIYLTISDPEIVFLKHLILPALPEKEIPAAIKWQLKEEIAFDFKDSVYDWQTVNEYSDEEGAEKKQIVFILAKDETINKFLSIPYACGLEPIEISSPAFNYGNILNYANGSGQIKIQSILDVGHRDSVLYIYRDKKLNFIRRLAFSSEKLTQALTEPLLSDKGKIVLSLEKADQIKEAVGIPQDETAVLEDNIRAIYLISLMRPFLEDLTRELKYSFDYFISNFKGEAPAVLYLAGGGGNLKNLDWYLHKELDIDVSKLSLPGGIDTKLITKEKLDKDQNQIISALGATLPTAGEINLLPREFRARKIEFVERISLRLIAITVGAILLFSLFIARVQISIYKNKLQNAQTYLQSRGQIKVLEQVVAPLENLVLEIQSNKVPAEALLKLISGLLPGNITLDELMLDQNSHNLILKGRASGAGANAKSSLDNFVNKMKAAAYFSGLDLSSQENGKFLSFQIKCGLVY